MNEPDAVEDIPAPRIAGQSGAAAPRYWAFISYSHRDEKFASWLHRKLETYTGHKKLAGTRNRRGEPVPARIFPVFRDRDELEGAPDLPERIQDALRQSRFLIVICSPNSAQSKWVNEEIKAYKALGGGDRVLALIVGGEPNAGARPEPGLQECFPEALRFRVGIDGQLSDVPTEPIAADARKDKDGERNALLKLLAGILGLRFDDLKQRDLERQRRFWTWVAAGAATGLAVLSGLTIYAFQQEAEAKRQRDVAEERARIAQSRQLALAASGSMPSDLDRALLLAVEAAKVSPTFEARKVLWESLNSMPTLERFLESAGAPVTALAFDRDGRYVAAGHKDGAFTVWEVEGGRIATDYPRKLPDEIHSIAFLDSSDRRVAVVTLDDAVHLSLRGQPFQRSSLQVDGKSLAQVAFNPDGTSLATLSADGEVRLWTMSEWPPVSARVAMLEEADGIGLRFVQEGRQLAMFHPSSKTLMLIDPKSGEVARFPVERIQGKPLYAAINPQADKVAVIDSTNTLVVWGIGPNSGRSPPYQLPELTLHIEFSPSGESLVTVHILGSIMTFDTSAVRTGAYRLRSSATYAAVFDASEARLVAGGASGAVALWSPRRAGRAAGFSGVDICGFEGGTRHVTLGGPREAIAAACGSGAIRLTDPVRAEEPPLTISLPKGRRAESLAFLPSSERLLVHLNRGELAILDPRQTAKGPTFLFPERRDFLRIAASADGRAVAALAKNGEVLSWDLRTAESPASLQLPKGDWSALAIAADGRTIGVGGDRGEIVIVNPAGNRILAAASGDGAPISSLSFRPDGAAVASADERGGLAVWDLGDQQNGARRVEGLRGSSIIYAPGGSYLAVGTKSGLQLLDANSLRSLGRTIGGSEVTSAAFSNSGARVAWSAGGDAISLQDLELRAWIRFACQIANRQLTNVEIRDFLGEEKPLGSCADLPGSNDASRPKADRQKP